MTARPPTTYQLLIRVQRPTRMRVGALGELAFPAGFYTYTGSARRGLAARLARHRRSEKRLHWHIDYLLAAAHTEIVEIRTSRRPECEWNRDTPGEVIHPGFGASDCRAGCGAHLKWLPTPGKEPAGAL